MSTAVFCECAELGALVSAAGEEAQRQDQQLQFSSPLPGLSGHAEFIKLNNAGTLSPHLYMYIKV